MSYPNNTAAAAIALSNEWMKSWDEAEDKTPEVASEAERSCRIDGIPVNKRLFTLASEIRKANPALKFCAAAGYSWHGAQRVFTQMYVYREGHDYVLGKIGYGDYRLRKPNYDTINKYMVASRKIQNQKVKEYNDQHYMAITDNLANAVKNACKYLVPHTLAEIADMSFHDFGKEVREQKNDAINAARSVVEKCTSVSVVKAELNNLIRLGVEFVTPEFKNAAAELFKATAEAEVEKARRIGAYFVQFRNFGSTMRVDVLTFDKNFRNDIMIGEATNSTQMAVPDLPLDIQEKIAVLSMVEDGTSVPGVGRKVSATSFWLERELT